MKICQKTSVVVVGGGSGDDGGGRGGGGGGGSTTSDHSLQIPIFFHGLDKTCESVPLSLLPLFEEREREGQNKALTFGGERREEKKKGEAIRV